MTLAAMHDRKRITAIEGLERNGRLHLRTAFIEYDGIVSADVHRPRHGPLFETRFAKSQAAFRVTLLSGVVSPVSARMPVSRSGNGTAMITTSLSRRLLTVSAAFVTLLAGPLPDHPSERRESGDRDAALRLFHERIVIYAELQRRLERPPPQLKTTRNVSEIFVARQLLADAIRQARPGAQQGNIFSPEVSFEFKSLIAEALKGRDVEALLWELQSEYPEVYGVRSVVNEPLPQGATHEMPIVLLWALPALVEDLEYRIVNHDLVLWDIHANLVVDYIPNAFRPRETTLR